ncbi:glycosyltransferase [Salinibacter grassmerensis]|uniref:glycosyltransferase n=1 Tax=Salinibacter grassmerensis TaxID=3040353 RepID=UPI0021E82D84|nr:glycosyltransferase [Salinibacter grassmerensis]
MCERPSRVSLFWGSLVGGGIEHVMVALAQGFLNRGIDTDIVLLKKKGELLGSLPSDCRVFNLRANGLVESVPSLATYLRHHHTSVLLSAAPYPNRVALLAKVITGGFTPIVISEHNVSPIAGSRSMLPDWGLTHITKATYLLADRAVAVSEGVADRVSERLHMRREKFDVVYNPVVSMETLGHANRDVEHSWFQNSGTPVVLGVGRLVEEKGFSVLLEAFAKVRKSRRARLVIFGEGSERRALEQQAEHLGVSDQVWMPGFVSNPLKYMSKASVFVLSSKSEGLGNVLIEAMSCGTPVVSTDCPSGPAEILEGGKHGKLVPVEDPSALAMGVEEALDGKIDPAPRSALNRFQRDRVTEQYLDILSSVT